VVARPVDPGISGEEVLRRLLASGVAAYLTKPLDLAELGRLVHSFRTEGHSDTIPGTTSR